MIQKSVKGCLWLILWVGFLWPAVSEVHSQFHDPLYDICVSGERGIAVGYYGNIIISDDIGKGGWKKVSSGTKELLSCLSCPDGERAWVAGSNGMILATQDGGVTWKTQKSGTSNHLFGVFFIDNRKGWVVGEYGTILHTQDGGESWQPQQEGEDVLLEAVFFLNEKKGFAIGEFGAVMVTVDGGNSWSKKRGGEKTLEIEVFEQLKPTLYGLDFYDDKIGIAVGAAGCVLRTEDGGLTWEDIPSPTTNHLYRVKFTQGDLYAVGLRGTVLSSNDRGRTWKTLTLAYEDSFSWYYGIATDSQGLLLVGESGKVLKQQCQWKKVR